MNKKLARSNKLDDWELELIQARLARQDELAQLNKLADKLARSFRPKVLRRSKQASSTSD